MLRTTLLLFSLLIWTASLYSQENSDQQPDSVNIVQVSPKYVEQVSAKASSINDKLDKHTSRLLRRWKKQEQKIIDKLSKTDSTKANQLAADSKEQFSNLQDRLQNASSVQQYIPSMDTLSSSLNFLSQNPQLQKYSKQATEKLGKALTNTKELGNKFQQAEQLKKFLNERKQFLKERLDNLGFAKQLKSLNKQAYYYSAQVNEYKSLLKDHKKAERKALEALSKTKLFKDFMRKNSQLASLFRLPGSDDDPTNIASLAGLQTRAQVNNLIQGQIASGGPNAMAQVQQNMQEAQSKLNDLKGKILKSGGSSSEESFAEGFKPNDQKTKSFFKRLEFGTNIQSQKSRGYFPSTSDIGLSLGYKINDRSIIGIGASYKLGLGKDIRHMKISHQGLGLRSFVDWKIKGSFWLSGGYEMNYRAEFKNIQQLKELSAWQESGLIGVSKVVSLKTKILKKTKVQLMWDFLSYRQVPVTQPLIFRIGYSF